MILLQSEEEGLLHSVIMKAVCPLRIRQALNRELDERLGIGGLGPREPRSSAYYGRGYRPHLAAWQLAIVSSLRPIVTALHGGIRKCGLTGMAIRARGTLIMTGNSVMDQNLVVLRPKKETGACWLAG